MNGSVSRRYAKALLASGWENKTYEKVAHDLERVARLVHGTPELLLTLQNAVFSLSQRSQVLRLVCERLQLAETVTKAVLLLLARGHILRLPDVARELRRMVDEQMGLLRARVIAPRTVDLGTELRLQSSLEQMTGKKVIIEKAEDPNLLGGVVINLNDWVMDGSLATQLDQLRAKAVAHAGEGVLLNATTKSRENNKSRNHTE